MKKIIIEQSKEGVSVSVYKDGELVLAGYESTVPLAYEMSKRVE